MEIIELLEKAKEIMKQGWCVDHVAIDKAGNHVQDVTSPKAVKWCVYGAMMKAEGNDGYSAAPLTDKAVIELNKDLPPGYDGWTRHIINFNNEQKSVEPVLAQVDKTLARLTLEGRCS